MRFTARSGSSPGLEANEPRDAPGPPSNDLANTPDEACPAHAGPTRISQRDTPTSRSDPARTGGRPAGTTPSESTLDESVLAPWYPEPQVCRQRQTAAAAWVLRAAAWWGLNPGRSPTSGPHTQANRQRIGPGRHARQVPNDTIQMSGTRPPQTAQTPPTPKYSLLDEHGTPVPGGTQPLTLRR
jgi:hypothetical protein